MTMQVLGDGGGARRLCTTNEDGFIGMRVMIGREAGRGFMPHAGGVDQVNPQPGLTYLIVVLMCHSSFSFPPRLSLSFVESWFLQFFSPVI